MSDGDSRPPKGGDKENPIPTKSQQLNLERPSPHSALEQAQQARHAQRQRELGETNKTAQGLVDGLDGLAKARDRARSDHEEAESRWIREKYGKAPYKDVVRTVEHEQPDLGGEVKKKEGPEPGR